MGNAPAKHTGLELLEVPREVWNRSKRPFQGHGVRFSLGLAFVFSGLLSPSVAAKFGLIGLGVGLALALPMLVDGWLEKQAAQIGRTSRTNATGVLSGFENRRLIALFAPHAWVQIQKGRLHLILGDGRAAARAFGEAARMVGNIKEPILTGAQALGLTISGDRKDARALLVDLEEAGKLGARDRLNLGIVYVEEPGRVDRAAEHIEAARSELGEHPRVMAGLALAYARAGRMDDAREALEIAEDDEEALAADPLAPDLAKRARKDLRQADDGGGKSKGKTKKKGKAKKKDRRKDRREKRKQRAAAASESADSAEATDDEPADDEPSGDQGPSAAESDESLSALADEKWALPDRESEDAAAEDADDSVAALRDDQWSADDQAQADAIAAAMQEENSGLALLPKPPGSEEESDARAGEPTAKPAADEPVPDVEAKKDKPATPKAVTFEGSKPVFAPPPPITGPRKAKPAIKPPVVKPK